MSDETQSPNTNPVIPQNQVGANSEIEQIATDLTTLIGSVVDSFISGNAKDKDGADVVVVVKNSENAEFADVTKKLVDNRLGNSSAATVDFKQILTEVKTIIRSANVTDSDSDVYQANVKTYLDLLETKVINKLIGNKETDEPGAHDLYDTLKELNDLFSAGDVNLKTLIGNLSTALDTAKANAANLIAAEATARAAAIGVEASARAAAQVLTDERIDGAFGTLDLHDSAITVNATNIDIVSANLAAEVTARTTAISAESSARTAAINALESRLGTQQQFKDAKDKIVNFKPFKKK